MTVDHLQTLIQTALVGSVSKPLQTFKRQLVQSFQFEAIVAGSNYTCYGLNRTHSRHNPVLIRSLLHRNYNSIQSTALHLNSLSPLRDVSSHISAENSIHNLTRDSSAENSCSGCCCLVDADISLDDIGTLMIYNDHLLSLLDYDVLAVLVN